LVCAVRTDEPSELVSVAGAELQSDIAAALSAVVALVGSGRLDPATLERQAD
jgi:hypothetical protein